MSRGAAPRGRVHIVGAGLAGLAAAVDLADAGCAVVLYDSAQHAGGRCRSFFDTELGLRIDNGNHLLLSGNTAALQYIRRIGALETFEQADEAVIPFVDLASGERWAVRPSGGRIPWWLLQPSRRIPGTRLRDYFSALRLRTAGAEATVSATLKEASPLFTRLWQPLTVAALNTGASEASARLLWRILADTLGRGAAACKPLIPRQGLSESLVDPALEFLARCGAAARFGCLLKSIAFSGSRAVALEFDDAVVGLGPEDSAILAVPAAAAARLVPGLTVPDDHAPIVNAHFRYAPPKNMPPLLGLIGGSAEWVFRKQGVLSVTVSAADRLVNRPAAELRALLWQDVARALELPPEPVPSARVVKERRATFRATPLQLKQRPASDTQWSNLRLAGDYVETGLPATIEGAIRSGFAAAGSIRQRHLTASVLRAGAPADPFLSPVGNCPRALP